MIQFGILSTSRYSCPPQISNAARVCHCRHDCNCGAHHRPVDHRRGGDQGHAIDQQGDTPARRLTHRPIFRRRFIDFRGIGFRLVGINRRNLGWNRTQDLTTSLMAHPSKQLGASCSPAAGQRCGRRPSRICVNTRASAGRGSPPLGTATGTTNMSHSAARRCRRSSSSRTSPRSRHSTAARRRPSAAPHMASGRRPASAPSHPRTAASGRGATRARRK